MAPPQVTADAEGVIRSLSGPELAALLFDTLNAPLVQTAVLIEFRRRFWARCEESAAHGWTSNIPPGA
jgi:hypothetical protein